jgi:hypothetical protein
MKNFGLETKKLLITVGLAIESFWSPYEWQLKQFGHHEIGN